MNKLEKLCQLIDYDFTRIELLEAALSHRSVGGQNNERLEFLGDSILNFVITIDLFKRYPKAKEGELSRLRASLVNGETLAIIASELSIGNYLRLGAGELKSGGSRRESILADALEAIIGAIYLDADFETCQRCILHWFAGRLLDTSVLKIPKDPKTQLQEYLQGQRLALPEYRIVSTEGEAHAQTFHVECVVTELGLRSVGSANSRRKAEQEAAQQILAELKQRQ